ncbi:MULTISPECIES: xanthine dehydrogenase accessory protein XdhC [Brenneria]|uniref:Xanthine dehydrogenase accessory protein XdhC n=1 Tax=Brenneria nigrifluens DSM 30175 = ATCC 13028 TaxID=1121120 RepID=A0A2U1UM65_9GAMM|nr:MULTISPECIES: xanthine dehydrogenase accessory protein XdhC [Brenneria]EHD23815.1 xanthine dehydrogenase accessory protein XdhC [Brenneria sp. EniD312]PWC22672.1 xanthine dehydrogenase accessory protein XdhC [Brenneria nigrifluens DSM 30175 = ATCC 13028]QCR06724.1 xanthine dehydrogenase accessory protein XdhC [Brenneria nigrifluens DSM 30175 = ATCC 13028]
MDAWIDELAALRRRGAPCVLVTLVDEQGSTPRNRGSKMLVTAERAVDTIGGGHLEFQALEIARNMLKKGDVTLRLDRFPLAARLGQCCGGAISVLFEPLIPPRPQVALFGAGHVGRALARILATLPLRMRWIDNRPEQFPAAIPEGIDKIVSEDPLDEVDACPPGSYYIVMTHDHPLDLALAERILRRNDAAYFGLIGSLTKRKRFEYKLGQRGISADALAAMRCPLGLPDVKGKLPAEIAVAVAGEIIACYGRRAMSRNGASLV